MFVGGSWLGVVVESCVCYGVCVCVGGCVCVCARARACVCVLHECVASVTVKR